MPKIFIKCNKLKNDLVTLTELLKKKKGKKKAGEENRRIKETGVG